MISFEVNTDDIKAVVAELNATEKQVAMAARRALRRTAGTLRVRASKALVTDLDLRRANTIRRRLKDLKMKATKGLSEVGIWIGLNDLRIGDFKGSPEQTETGASFRGQAFPGAFVAKSKRGGRSIFKRRDRGRFPLIEQTFPIKDRADVVLEDDVFTDVSELFMKNFMADLRARVTLGVGGRQGKKNG